MSNTKNLRSLGSKKTVYKTDKVDASLLETFKINRSLLGVHNNMGFTLVPFVQERDEFTSLCPKTGQPDHAKMEIIYIPNDKMIESKSLKLYLFSFRNEGSFHEDVCNTIANDLCEILNPKYLRVYGDFAPRGGLAIKPLVERWGRYTTNLMREGIYKLVKSWDIKK